MPAKLQFPSYISKVFTWPVGAARRTRRPLWILGLVMIAGLAAWANSARAAATTSPTNATALARGLKLALGTVNLDNTDLAIEPTSAATLLPLWQLLGQLSTSSSAAPEEITAVIKEIKLNMTSAQIKAIDAMSIDVVNVPVPNPSASSGASSASSSGSTAQAAAADPSLGGVAGGAPMDAGGGPMPSSISQTGTSTAKSSGTAAPAAIQQVIQLLAAKIKG